MLRSLFRQTHCSSLRELWRRNLPRAFTVSLKPAHVGHWSSCKVVSISAVTSCDPAYSVVRCYCSLSESDIKRKVDEITDLFSDARELLDDAVSSFHFVGTMYTICVSIVHVCTLSVSSLSRDHLWALCTSMMTCRRPNLLSRKLFISMVTY